MTAFALVPAQAHLEATAFSPRGPVDAHVDAFRSLFERTAACMASVNPALDLQEVNRQFIQELIGHRTAVGHNLLDFVQNDDLDGLRLRFAQLIAGTRGQIVEAVVCVTADDRHVPATLTAVAVHQGGSTAVVTLRCAEALPQGRQRRLLTELDARILEGVAAGISTIGLAAKLYLSRQGVEYHVGTMLKKFKAPNRAALVSRAYAMGVLASDLWPPRVNPAFVK
jgi:PAS domain S-box-containing protein